MKLTFLWKDKRQVVEGANLLATNVINKIEQVIMAECDR